MCLMCLLGVGCLWTLGRCLILPWPLAELSHSVCPLGTAVSTEHGPAQQVCPFPHVAAAPTGCCRTHLTRACPLGAGGVPFKGPLTSTTDDASLRLVLRFWSRTCSPPIGRDGLMCGILKQRRVLTVHRALRFTDEHHELTTYFAFFLLFTTSYMRTPGCGGKSWRAT